MYTADANDTATATPPQTFEHSGSAYFAVDSDRYSKAFEEAFQLLPWEGTLGFSLAPYDKEHYVLHITNFKHNVRTELDEESKMWFELAVERLLPIFTFIECYSSMQDKMHVINYLVSINPDWTYDLELKAVELQLRQIAAQNQIASFGQRGAF